MLAAPPERTCAVVREGERAVLAAVAAVAHAAASELATSGGAAMTTDAVGRAAPDAAALRGGYLADIAGADR